MVFVQIMFIVYTEKGRGGEMNFAFPHSLPFLMQENDEGEADDHEKGAHKPFPDICLLGKQVSEENNNEEAQSLHGDHIDHLGKADGNHVGANANGVTETGKH
jgi:hypothetical protein